MTGFYNLEVAVLDAIAAQYPIQQEQLLAQFRAARVIGRRNSGAGCFTDFEIDQCKAAPVKVPRVIGKVCAQITGFQSPTTLLVFTENGYTTTLEGAACSDGTENVNVDQVQFRIIG